MDARGALKLSINMGGFIANAYLEDLSDEDLMQRPVEGCNHINWQLGHLINAEHQMIGAVCPGTMPDLPEGCRVSGAFRDGNVDGKRDLQWRTARSRCQEARGAGSRNR